MALSLNTAFRRVAAAAALAAVGLAAVIGGSYALAVSRFKAPGPMSVEAVVYLPPGTSLHGIAELLAEKHAIASPWLFMGGVTALGDERPLKAGEYRILARASMREIMDLLKEGRTVVRKLTIAEGLATRQILAAVAEAEGLDGAIYDPPGEGRLLPETYFYSYGDLRHDMVRRMARKMEETLDAAWARRAEGLPLASPEDALILASIIEKETGRPEERAQVAAVFVNRLKKGMKLQSDPTVIYALTEGRRAFERPLSKSDLEAASPYNTYVVSGLPPGPIANPGRDSIEAAVRPAETGDLYFVSDGRGGHLFARSLAEHNRNVAKLRRIEKQDREEESKEAAGKGAD